MTLRIIIMLQLLYIATALCKCYGTAICFIGSNDLYILVCHLGQFHLQSQWIFPNDGGNYNGNFPATISAEIFSCNVSTYALDGVPSEFLES